jgi:hypothetical protein
MRLHHSPSHWILVILVLLALLLILDEAHGQTPVPASPSPTQAMGAAAMFQGRPAMAGAQAGLGAEAGPPQGGIGVQGPQDAERPLHLRPPSAVAQAVTAPLPLAVASAPSRRQIVPPRDSGYASEHHSVPRKVKRAAKRTIRRAHTGTSPIDSSASTPR